MIIYFKIQREKNDYIQAAMVRSHQRHLNHGTLVYSLSIGQTRSVYYSETPGYPNIVR